MNKNMENELSFYTTLILDDSLGHVKFKISFIVLR